MKLHQPRFIMKSFSQTAQ